MGTKMQGENILHITAADLDADNVYIGGADVSGYDGSIEIAADLGVVRFKASLVAKLRIRALAGSGIEADSGIKAGRGIEAGWGIKAGSGIEAGWGIKAGGGIEAGWGIKAGSGIKAGWGIKAGDGIEAGSGIKAGWGIEAGSGIKAGGGIKAGSGIKAGFSITSKWVSARLRIFAGLCMWRAPTPEEMKIRAELRGGVIAFGVHEPMVCADAETKPEA
jgi:hypothetical protein